MNSYLRTLPLLLPLAEAFVEKHERIILRQGDPLTESQMADAKKAGVTRPGKIRVLRVDNLPLPDGDEELHIAKRMGLYQITSSALAMQYGIYLKRGFWEDRLVLVHELVHVAQYERLGGIRPFLEHYLHESLDPGYPFGRLQQEAIHVSRDICKCDT